ncbi:hypothetical protein A3J11_00245 [Candidatus Kaiserbacteria bacterium RIFCSPLOWO2_02_FULL_55_12]|uniref:Uncharacterized protein n=2 Tax=Candidatus Kaiseribacteriota TaxID=1752734 RepID=A0A1F6EZY0_9BACT|nr:MAG: hypothetical protein UY94_C0033G0005 [Parcubacteria group bacterium GW2011_GWA2_56_21]OGG64206.1 MAG: hypothetical protein A3C94_03195 [Candidatus Kaiserbacteria bacterium RIFCSPHIGHO2_02_FULL_55_17]OGG79160.1 MAG: hypothetical protein A3J11_00245 [Candidatus Kaiserbacteria bacterium RIFCSPLOWO2_02_FULL_55_12]
MTMKTVFEHIEHVKGKPHHIRKKVAFTAAVVVTAFIALVWLVGSLSLGAFALEGSSFADATEQGKIDVTNTADTTSALAGAAAALQKEDAPARIEIVDTAPPKQKKAEPTVIPF